MMKIMVKIMMKIMVKIINDQDNVKIMCKKMLQHQSSGRLGTRPPVDRYVPAIKLREGL